MKNIIYILFALLITGCTTNPDTKECEKRVKTLLGDFIQAVESRDYNKLELYANDDFIIYENGQVWDLKKFTQELEEMGEVQITYELSDIHAIVDASIAHMHYMNQGTFVYPDTTVVLNFIESATFMKEDEKWNIKFYHSTHLK